MGRTLHATMMLLLGALFVAGQNAANSQPATTPPAAPQPQWVQAGQPTKQAWQMTWFLQHAGSLGLNPANYDASKLSSQLQNFDNAGAPDLNAQLTASLRRYVSDLNFGRMGQKTPEQEHALDQTVYELSTSQNPNQILAKLSPPYPQYPRLLKALPQYERLAAEDKFELIPLPRKPVKAGEDWPGFPRVQQILTETGDLPGGVSVADAIKSFQRRHNLKPDGILHRETIAQMNVPFSWRLRQIQLTIERFRELPRSYSPPMVIVNVPAFQLQAFGDGYQPALSMNVVDGEAIGHQTPTFSGQIQYVVFNPYWDVPEDIAKKQVVPLFRRDPKYFEENGFEIVDHSSRVVARRPERAALDGVMAGKYRIRQRPGPKNALGDIKFVFPNTNDIYMHGTPEHQLFAHMDRDFSHGCIRLQDPEKMADWIFSQGYPDWTPDKIHDAMTGGTHRWVKLKKTIPVVIMYATAAVTPSGEVRFFNDMYGLDAALNRELMQQDRQRSSQPEQQTSLTQETALK